MRANRRTFGLAFAAAALALVAGCGGGGAGGAAEIRIPLGAGGVGFLPLYVMRDRGLIEKHAEAAGLDVTVRWIELGGPAVMNDALLSGSVDFIAAGPPAFITLWDRTRGSADVRGVAAMSSLPMYLNTTNPNLRSIDDLTETDKIAVTAVKVSIPSIVMQMYAAERYGTAEAFRFDRYTVTMTHADAVIALLSGGNQINAHFTSPPFHQREIEDPAVRTIMTTDDVLGGPTTFTMLSTTAAFRERNPDAYRAILGALEEAVQIIRDDPEHAADVLIAADAGAGFPRDKLIDVLTDPAVRFTTVPENVMRYAQFMFAVGSISAAPESWRELFFPEIHSAPGG